MARLRLPVRSSSIGAVLAASWIVGREVLGELAFGRSGEWLEENTWLLGDFLAWQPVSTIIVSVGLVIVAAVIITRFSEKEETMPAKKRPKKSGDDGERISARANIIGSVGQRGGQTTQTVNIGKQQRTLSNIRTDPFVARLAPFQGTQVTLVCLMGDPESHQFATEIHQLLQTAGWITPGVNQAMFERPRKGIILQSPGPQFDEALAELGRCLVEMGFEAIGEIGAPESDRRVLVRAG